MANVTIPNLTSATTIAPSTDLMVLEQTNGTRKATLSQIFTSSATSGSGLGITSGGVYTIKSGLDSNISDINTLLGNTNIASIGDGTVTGAISTLNSDLTFKSLAIPTPSVSNRLRTYTIDLSDYKEVFIRFGTSGYSPNKYSFYCPISNLNCNDVIDDVDDNGYTWRGSVSVTKTSILAYTNGNSTNPDNNYFIITTILAR